ncbi:MAG: hypothetical protein ACD_73C00039G0001 [uncultured bacterium]|nr:MAG: hypothetical protein ACD_73C00039G0001 [uncultured bacterium]
MNAHNHQHPHNPSPPTPKLANVKSVIAVASGKGGVGKSTVAVNLACALSKLNKKVGLLDADIYGPSQHIMLGLTQLNPEMDENRKITPPEKYGLSIMSFGFFVKPEEAVVWRGPMVARMLQQLIEDVNWGALDYLVVDLPPGTGDVQLTLTQLLQVTGSVIVSTPQDVALADAIKSITMFRKVNVEILGLVENMAFFACPHCEHETNIFSRGGGKETARVMNIPFLGELPLEESTRTSGDKGTPIVFAEPASAQAKRFLDMAKQVDERVKEIVEHGFSPLPVPPMGKVESFSV